MASSPLARAACRNSDFSASVAISFGVLAFASAALWAGESQTARAEKEGKSRPFDWGKTAIATANWFGESPGEDVTLSAVCVNDDGSFVCMVPPNTGEKNHLTLTVDGIERDSEILSIDPVSGLCLARAMMSEASEPVSLFDENDVSAGDEVVLLDSDVMARLAGIDREYLGESLQISMLRIHLSEKRELFASQPIFLPSGELVGFFTHRELSDEKEAHAIPAARIAKLIADFDAEKPTGRIWIGASFHKQSTTPEIVRVSANSPAEKAGLQPGDIVMKIDGLAVSSLPELASACESLVDNEPINLSILRGLKVVDCKLVPKVVGVNSEKSEKK